MKTPGCVLLPQPIQEEALQLLRDRGIEVIQAPDTEEKTSAPLVKKAGAVVLRTGIKMTGELMEKADDLLTISRTGAGFDNVDIKTATEKGIIVTSSIGVNTSSVVEHCLAMMLSLFKQLFLLDRELRKGNFKIRYKNYPHDLRNKYLGVIGFGRIGSLLAENCSKLFNMKILAHDPYLNEDQKEEYIGWVKFVEIEEIFRKSDIISVHIPLTDESRNLINIKYFRLMKPYAFIINTSRGGVVNEEDLVQALERGLIAGAGLDVFEKEPVEIDNPLLRMDKVILTPHCAALTGECVVEMALNSVERVIDLFDNYLPMNIANPEVLKLEKWKNLKKK